jgi:hypothetical protein
MGLVQRLRSALRLEMHETSCVTAGAAGGGGGGTVAVEGGGVIMLPNSEGEEASPNLYRTLRASVQQRRWGPHVTAISQLEDGGVHSKFMRLTVPLICAHVVELAERTMPTFEGEHSASSEGDDVNEPLQMLLGIRERVARCLASGAQQRLQTRAARGAPERERERVCVCGWVMTVMTVTRDRSARPGIMPRPGMDERWGWG